MAVITRYFSTTSAGAGDGTTWADRAALIVSSAYNTIITGFNFGGSDSLECRIGPGSYSVPTMVAATFTVAAPTGVNSLWLMACDTNGDLWVPPDLNWVSAQPMWSTSGMPVLTTSTAVTAFNVANVNLYGLDISSSMSGAALTLAGLVAWCRVTNTASTTSVRVCDINASNCVIRATGTAFSMLVNALVYTNCRLEGNASASSGNRRCYNATTANIISFARCTILNCVGNGIVNTGAGRLLLNYSTMINCGTAISWSSTSEPGTVISNCIINGNTTGVSNAAGNTLVIRNRLRDNTTNFSLNAHSKELQNITTSGTDAAEFLDASNGDYRIKSTSSLWGLRLGPGDELVTGRGGQFMRVIQSQRNRR